jgi:hypothetical protein
MEITSKRAQQAGSTHPRRVAPPRVRSYSSGALEMASHQHKRTTEEHDRRKLRLGHRPRSVRGGLGLQPRINVKDAHRLPLPPFGPSGGHDGAVGQFEGRMGRVTGVRYGPVGCVHDVQGCGQVQREDVQVGQASGVPGCARPLAVGGYQCTGGDVDADGSSSGS